MKVKWLDIGLNNFESYGEPTLPVKFMGAKLTGSTNWVKRCFTIYWIDSNAGYSTSTIRMSH